jgi:two-component system, sensor histidine kinase
MDQVPEGANGNDVLCLCPTSADVRAARGVFSSAGLAARVFEESSAFADALDDKEIGVLLVAEEALGGPAGVRIRERLAAQEDWSAIPLIILAGSRAGAAGEALQDYETYGRVTLLERPVRLADLVAVVRMALAERCQQYRVRDLLAERSEAISRRDEFLAMLGHELRNPLGAISMCSEVLARTPDGAAARQCAAMIQRQSRDMKRLLDDLLDVSRITRGQLKLTPEPVDLGDILRDVRGQIEHHLDARRQRLDVRLPGVALPLHGDATRLGQVFVNLIHNATRYSPPGSLISLEVDHTDDAVAVRVRDPGEGMAPETLARLFEPFFRAKARGDGGLGVGLTLAHRLVKMHGGTLEAMSEGPGRGSTFVVRLPLAQQAPEAKAQPTREAGRGDGRQVLVIDDNRELAFGLRLLLRGRGYRVMLAHDGGEGLAAAEREHPDVVLLDIGLPDMDGFEVARRLRRLPGLDGVRLVAMSGYGGEEQHRLSREAGIDQYLIKPVALDALEGAMGAT